MTITGYRPDGSVEFIYHGPSDSELLTLHRQGKCHADCSICYAEACAYQQDLRVLIEQRRHAKPSMKEAL